MMKEVSDLADRIRSLKLPCPSGIITRAYQYNDAMKKYEACLSRLVALGPLIGDDLVRLLSDESVDVRYAAAIALRDIGSKLDGNSRDQACAAFKKALEDNGHHVIELEYHFWEDLPEEYLLCGSASNSELWGASIPKAVAVSEIAREVLQRMDVSGHS